MSLENTNLSRRNLLRAGALGVPAAGVLAFGSTLVTATSANAISTDGWWGSETSSGLQQFMNTVMNAGLVVDGVISSQSSEVAPYCPGIVGGWEWVPKNQAMGSPTMYWMIKWLAQEAPDAVVMGGATLTKDTIYSLQGHYGVSKDGRLDALHVTSMTAYKTNQPVRRLTLYRRASCLLG